MDKEKINENTKEDNTQTSVTEKDNCFAETKKRLAWRAFEYMMFNDEENQ